MYPILFSLGPIILYAQSIFLLFSWVSFSFLFWRHLRRWGVSEDHIFDATFYATIVAFIASRAGFIVSHWDTFAAETPLLMLALWVAPGFTWYPALYGAVGTLIIVCKRVRIRMGLLLDAISRALPYAILFGLIGAFLDGTYVGKKAALPWAIAYVGHIGYRHPVQVYQIIALFLIMLVMHFLYVRSERQKWSYGTYGIWFFLVLSISFFILEFFSEGSVYWGMLNANQWMLIGIFAESIGALYVRGGGKEFLVPLGARISLGVQKGVKGAYAKLFKRSH